MGEEIMSSILEFPLMLYSTARSAGFTLQYQLLESIGTALPPKRSNPRVKLNELLVLRKDLMDLLRRDSQNIVSGVYPVSVLKPESPFEHLLRFPRLLADGFSIHI